MNKFITLILGIMLSLSAVAEITDEQVKQYILIENNSQKCFEPELWNAKTEEKRQAILDNEDLRQQNDRYRHEIALMAEIFGDDAIAFMETNADSLLAKNFTEKLKRLNKRQTTVKIQQDCDELSQYRYRILRKHYYGENE